MLRALLITRPRALPRRPLLAGPTNAPPGSPRSGSGPRISGTTWPAIFLGNPFPTPPPALLLLAEGTAGACAPRGPPGARPGVLGPVVFRLRSSLLLGIDSRVHFAAALAVVVVGPNEPNTPLPARRLRRRPLEGAFFLPWHEAPLLRTAWSRGAKARLHARGGSFSGLAIAPA